MTLRLYNTLGREKQDFIPLEKDAVKMYSCGPTVYNYMHIGNLRAFLFADLLKRYLTFKGYRIHHVMNITDVDDKTIRDSKKAKKSLSDFTEFYTKAFLEDLATLTILPPDHMPKAAQHIHEMVELIRKMKEHTYQRDGTTYCRISSIKEYGKLALLDRQNLKKNADGRLSNDEYDKEDARDFALWKAYEESDGDVFWDTELGKGRPGWHIECSAMSMKYLGESFDIHTGGVDLVFPHHTNEIAQSECATGKRYASFWLHNEHLLVNGEKMSKSLGNFFTLKDLLKKGYEPRAIRYELLKTHYRMKLDFKEEELRKIPETLKKFDEIVHKLQHAKGARTSHDISMSYLTSFEREMDDDLNISGGLAEVFGFIKEVNKQIDDREVTPELAKTYLTTLQKFNSVLGVMHFETTSIPEPVVALAEKRLKAKKDKDFSVADKIRDQIREMGFEILDEKTGYRVKKVE